MSQIKKIFLEHLPKRIYRNRECIHWEKCINKKVKFIFNDIEGEIEIVDYNKLLNKIKVKYNDKVSYIEISNFHNVQLANVIGLRNKNYKVEIGEIFKDDKRDFNIIDRCIKSKKNKNGYITKEKWYKYHCNKCGAELWIEESHLLKCSYGCSCCRGLTVIKGINDISTTNPELTKYFVNIEDVYTHTKGSNKKVLMMCPDCGNKKILSINQLSSKGFSCPKCSDGISYPNKFMFNLLKQLEIKFETEYSPDWIKPKRYDFYIPSKNLIIEMDGGWHKIDNNLSQKTVLETKEIDNYKDKIAEEHGLEVVRIDCDYKRIEKRFEYVKNNISKSKINNIFDLINIDWISIEENCNNNIIKNVCDYWMEHNYFDTKILTTKELSNIFNLSNSCIRNYLNKGNKLGWCNYNGKEHKGERL